MDKQLWENLAKENYKYYINSDYGKNITDQLFWDSGERDFEKLILKDELLINKLGSFGNKTILEVGCGAGRILKPMTKYFKRVIGLDISGEMVSQAKQKVEAELIETNGSEIPVEPNSIDLVFSYIVFQHIKSYVVVEENFKNIFKAIKPGGIFKVLLRSKKLDSMNKWWAGVHYKGQMIEHLYKKYGYNLIKKEETGDGRTWLWLEKPCTN